MNKKKKLIIINIIFIFAGIAGVIVYNFSIQSPANSNRDLIIADMHHLYHQARIYYSKSEDAKNNNPSFRGWKIPEEFIKNKNASYEGIYENNRIIIIGTGYETGMDNKLPVKIKAIITYSNIIINVLN